MFSRKTILLSTLTIAVLFLKCVVAQADEADKKAETVAPRIAMCVPLAVPIDATTKVILRGWGLEGAREVRSSNPLCTLKILTTAKATVPNKQDAKQVGDTQIELEVIVPKDIEPSELDLTVVQPDMASMPHKLLIGCNKACGGQSMDEKEPNDGFTQAQSLQLPQTVDGRVDGDGNVDVFAFELTKLGVPNSEKRRITIEVHAHRYGSNLDSVLTLFDQRANIIAVNDDSPDTKVKDSKINLGLSPGKYFISLQDAHDRGGPAHPYRLTVIAEPAPQ